MVKKEKMMKTFVAVLALHVVAIFAQTPGGVGFTIADVTNYTAIASSNVCTCNFFFFFFFFEIYLKNC